MGLLRYIYREMIRSTKTTLRFARLKKREHIVAFVDEYRKAMQQFVDLMWVLESVQTLVPKDITKKVETWLSARAVQCAAKQASGVVRGAKQKQKQRLFAIGKLTAEGKFKQARKLQRIYDAVVTTKPKVDNVECELDARFVKQDFANQTSFDGWVTLGSLGNKLKIELPVKKHDHFNRLLARGGVLRGGIRLSKQMVTFMFDLPEPVERTESKILGIDIGQTTALSCSDGQIVDCCPHGHTYKSICCELARKKRGSRNFAQKVIHRTNYINYTVNRLNFTGVGTVNREDIKNMRNGRRGSRSLSHWNYAELFDRLDAKLEEQGVLVCKFSPTYTSQRCSACGWVRKGNRSGKRFRCDKCFHEQDADLNAATNLSLSLSPISTRERLLHRNRTGFFWCAAGEEPISPSHSGNTKT